MLQDFLDVGEGIFKSSRLLAVDYLLPYLHEVVPLVLVLFARREVFLAVGDNILGDVPGT